MKSLSLFFVFFVSILSSANARELQLLEVDSDWSVLEWAEYKNHQCALISPLEFGNQVAVYFRSTTSREYMITVKDQKRQFPTNAFYSDFVVEIDSSGAVPLDGYLPSPRDVIQSPIGPEMSFSSRKDFETFLGNLPFGRNIYFLNKSGFAPIIVPIGRLGNAHSVFADCTK